MLVGCGINISFIKGGGKTKECIYLKDVHLTRVMGKVEINKDEKEN